MSSGHPGSGTEGSFELCAGSVTERQHDDPAIAVPVLPDWVRGSRVLLVHDWLVTWAGAERVLAQLCILFPEADVIVSLARGEVVDKEMGARVRETWLGRLPGTRRDHRWFLPLEALAFMSVDTRSYDLVISSSHAFAKAIRRPARAVHICYCHTPPRYLWDLYDSHWRSATLAQRLALASGRSLLRWLDRQAAGGVDHFVCNSRYVAARVRRYYGREAYVVHPPVEQKPGAVPGAPRQDFALYLGRLVAYKRVDLAIQACRKIGLPLVVAGDGPERKKLERLAAGSAVFLGRVSEHEAGMLLSSCRVFVFCAEEDFGIAPLEANAHGTPVVYYGRGGLMETMIPGVTGEMFGAQSVDDVVAALRRALGRSWDEATLRRHAELYSPRRFREAFAEVLRQLPVQGAV